MINPPTLWILKRLKRHHHLVHFSTFINLLEILGYTTVIYSLGGIEATYLTPIYAALIAYVGAMTERWRTFLIAGTCATAYTVMVLLEGAGMIPWHRVNPQFTVTWPSRIMYLSVVVALLFVIAYIASGFAETEWVTSALQLGAGAYVRKPYSIEQIGRPVKDVLGQASGGASMGVDEARACPDIRSEHGHRDP